MKHFYLYFLAFSLIVSFNAFAQEESSSSNYALEEIVVTAQKKEDTIQTVPIAITRFPNVRLKTQNIYIYIYIYI